VVGREAGTAPNFNYSDAMKKFKQKWTPERRRKQRRGFAVAQPAVS